MKNIRLYDKTRTYMYPTGALATPEDIVQNYPAVQVFEHIIETDARQQVIYSIQNLSAARENYGIDPALDDAQAISAIQEAVNAPIEQAYSPEERLAAAIEMQVMLAMPDIKEMEDENELSDSEEKL